MADHARDTGKEAETLTLAPQAGTGLGREMFEQLLTMPNLSAIMARAAYDGLQAMTPRRWDPGAKEWISDPDYRIRTQTLFSLLAQAEGEPIKRSIKKIVTETETKTDEIEQQLRDNPAARAAMRKILEGAERADRDAQRAEERRRNQAAFHAKKHGADVIDVD